jgi:hypothetical protein
MEQLGGNGLPKKNSLNRADWQVWARETVIYNLIPPAIAALNLLYAAAMQGHFIPSGQETVFIVGGFYTAFLAALINLLGKYKAGV